MVKKVNIGIGKQIMDGQQCSITVKGINNANTMSLPSIDGKRSSQGRGCVVISAGDDQRKCVITGAFIVP